MFTCSHFLKGFSLISHKLHGICACHFTHTALYLRQLLVPKMCIKKFGDASGSKQVPILLVYYTFVIVINF